MIKTVSYPLHEVSPYINWIYFFHAWGYALHFASIGKVHNCPSCRRQWIDSFPEADREKAETAVQLFDDAQKEINHLDAKYHTHGRFGLFPAWSEGDNIMVELPDDRVVCFPFLRQQQVQKEGKPNLCLCDYIRPKELGKDQLGLFATTVEPEMEHLYADDPYKRMLAQTLCDRLSEATAEKLHEDIRKTFWGFAPDEHYSPQELLDEPYRGIRPAVGYPSIPDQGVNFIIEDCLHFSEIGIHLTENGAMSPHASVSGLVFAHPQSAYFHIGKIGEDQLQDYARRRGITIEKARKFLAANI